MKKDGLIMKALLGYVITWQISGRKKGSA